MEDLSSTKTLWIVFRENEKPDQLEDDDSEENNETSEINTDQPQVGLVEEIT